MAYAPVNHNKILMRQTQVPTQCISAVKNHGIPKKVSEFHGRSHST